MTEFRIDVILNSLKELEQEKRRLEARLSSERTKRKDLEAKSELVNTKHKQVTEKYNKMLETRNVARRKVKETQDQVDRLQRIHEDKQKAITELKRKIQEEKDQQENDLLKFVEQLGILRDKFRDAHKNYADESLNEKIIQLEERISDNKTRVQDYTDAVQELSQKLENSIDLDSDEHRCQKLEKEPWEEITEEEISTCLSIFNGEFDYSSEKLHELKCAVLVQKKRLDKLQEQM